MLSLIDQYARKVRELAQHPSSQRSGIHWDSKPINLRCLTRLALCGVQEYPAASVGEHTDPCWVRKTLNKTDILLFMCKSSNNCDQNIENLLYPPCLIRKSLAYCSNVHREIGCLFKLLLPLAPPTDQASMNKRFSNL